MQSVHYSAKNIPRTWTIDKTAEHFSYDNVVYAFPGEQVIFPVEPTWTQKDVFLLHYLADLCEKNNETDSVQLKNGLLTFTVSTLKSSCYKLSLIPMGVSISIEVISSGVKWGKKQGVREIVVNAIDGKVM